MRLGPPIEHFDADETTKKQVADQLSRLSSVPLFDGKKRKRLRLLIALVTAKWAGKLEEPAGAEHTIRECYDAIAGKEGKLLTERPGRDAEGRPVSWDAHPARGLIRKLRQNLDELNRNPNPTFLFEIAIPEKKYEPCIRRYLHEQSAGQVAPPADMTPYAGKEWHNYHVTKDNKGEFWSYKVLKFPNEPGSKTLETTAISLPDMADKQWSEQEKENHRYRYRASLADTHLVIVTTKCDHTSDAAIELFKHPQPHLGPMPGIMLVTDTYAHAPAVTISIMSLDKLRCDGKAVPEKPIRDENVMRELSEEWQKLCRQRGVQFDYLIPGRGQPFDQGKDIMCKYRGTDLEASRYTSSQHRLLRTIRDIHVCSESGAEQYDDPEIYELFKSGLTTFFQNPNSRFILVTGHRGDRKYIEMIIGAVKSAAKNLRKSVKEVQNRIICYKLHNAKTMVTNFIIMDYKNGSSEVVFGWGLHAKATSGNVVSSKEPTVVSEFDASFKNLCQSEVSVPVSLQSLLGKPCARKRRKSMA